MTRDQILNMPHLKVAEVKPNMFVHVHVEDGYMITAWSENEDIKDYSASVCMYMPIRDNYPGEYRVITIEEHQEFERLQNEAFAAENNQNE